MTRIHRLLLTFIVLLAIGLAGLSTVQAHERRTVDDYQLVFGWRGEPAFVGLMNGPKLFVFELTEDGEQGDPVTGLEETLTLEVTFGPASKVLVLRPAFGDPGHYIADLIPTRPGDYSFRLTGTIGDVEIDEAFTSADGEFGTVEPVTDIMFPDDELPSLVELQTQLEELRAMIEALQNAAG